MLTTSTGASSAEVRGITKLLKEAGIIGDGSGRGGMELRKQPKQLTLLDIYRATAAAAGSGSGKGGRTDDGKTKNTGKGKNLSESGSPESDTNPPVVQDAGEPAAAGGKQRAPIGEKGEDGEFQYYLKPSLEMPVGRQFHDLICKYQQQVREAVEAVLQKIRVSKVIKTLEDMECRERRRPHDDLGEAIDRIFMMKERSSIWRKMGLR